MKSKKPVKLSVHKNTIEKRRNRDLAKRLTASTKNIIKDNDIRAYALICVGSKGEGFVDFDTGNILPLWAFTPTIAAILDREIDQCGAEDGWKPNLPIKG